MKYIVKVFYMKVTSKTVKVIIMHSTGNMSYNIMVTSHSSQIVKVICAVMPYYVIICKGNILRKSCNDELQLTMVIW